MSENANNKKRRVHAFSANFEQSIVISLFSPMFLFFFFQLATAAAAAKRLTHRRLKGELIFSQSVSETGQLKENLQPSLLLLTNGHFEYF